MSDVVDAADIAERILDHAFVGDARSAGASRGRGAGVEVRLLPRAVHVGIAVV